MSTEAKYPSRFNPGVLITTEKWLAEYMCGRQASVKNIQLPNKFWSHPNFKVPWAKIYATQLRMALGLLKSYSPRAISLALRTKEGQKIYSLGAKWLDDIIKLKQNELNITETLKTFEEEKKPIINKEEEESIKLVDKRPEFNTTKNKLDKLRELD